MFKTRPLAEGLQYEWSRLQAQWLATSAAWKDRAHHQFEQDFMQPYEPALRATCEQLELLQQVIAQARHKVP